MYPPAPPVGVFIVALPFEPPLQATSVCEAAVAAKVVGCVTVIPEMVPVQPLASVIVTE